VYFKNIFLNWCSGTATELLYRVILCGAIGTEGHKFQGKAIPNPERRGWCRTFVCMAQFFLMFSAGNYAV